MTGDVFLAMLWLMQFGGLPEMGRGVALLAEPLCKGNVRAMRRER